MKSTGRRIGIVGCGWIGRVYAESCREVPGATVTACCAGHPDRARTFATELGIPSVAADHAELAARDDVDVVAVCAPNHLHHPVAIAALEAGKHVIVEKPLALSLEEGRSIITTAARVGRGVAYAENLCFAPKYERARAILDAGELGRVGFVKQVEKHDGPHTRWFYEAATAGGGALLDMGCHSIELVRWLLGKPAVTSVWAHMATWRHAERSRTDLEDHVVLHLAFEGGATALLEAGWTLLGGMASDLEVQGTDGVLKADLLLDGSGMKLYREAGDEPGWRSVDADWHRQNGYPQQLAHFLDCFESGETPRESAEDGLACLEVMLAAYESARTGATVTLPFRPSGVARPVDLWRAPAAGD